MDYMCELPNDAARRVALGSLPPDLNSTYERILSRVNQSNPETQKLVRRALRWITNDDGQQSFTTEALCEAVSIDLGNTRRNPDAIPDEFEILRWCSSLVRKSADGKNLELSHFTVKEFLTHIGSLQNNSIGAYRIDTGRDRLILARVCFTYLNFEDFDQGGPFSPHAVARRLQEYPFRHYAIDSWRGPLLDDLELYSLMQKLFSPSKPNTFISYMQDDSYMQVNFFTESPKKWFDDRENLSIINSGIAEATALHYAAMYHLAKLCSWLIKSGCDINKNTYFGTPLHCALLGSDTVWARFSDNPAACVDPDGPPDETVDLLLEAGATPNCYYNAGTRKMSPLFIALYNGKCNLALRLLDRGGILDQYCLDELEDELDPEMICKIVEHTTDQNLQPENRSRLLQLAVRAKTSNATRLMQADNDLPCQNSHYEQVLRTAAEFGQVEVVTRLLKDQKIDVDAADEVTGFSALHRAARTDQLEVTQILLDRGADSSRLDSMGRTALHRSVEAREVRCLRFLLHRDADTSFRDLEGMTVWHLAAQRDNIEALSILLSRAVDLVSAIGLKANDGRTALLYASANGSKEAMKLLLSAGSSLAETASDGSSSLHYAAEYGSLECVQFLIGQAIDPSAVTHDNSNAIHYAINGGSEKLTEIVRFLIEKGVDPCKARDDGCTPLHDLVNMVKEKLDEYEESEVEYIFAASRTLLKKLLEKSRLASDVRLGSELIYLACSHSFSFAHETVLSLLELGLDCNIPFANGRTPLMAAAESGNGAIFSTLLLHGADPDIKYLGLNALHCACFNGHKNILVLLRETGIDWNSKATTDLMTARRANVTALHLAARAEDSSVLEYLLNEGLVSNVDARTDCGKTPLSVAIWSRALKNVSLLLLNSVDTTVVDRHGNSAIHETARWGNIEVISEFMRYGSDLKVPNSHGLTPELVARKYGHKALAKSIMDYVNDQSGFHLSAPMKSVRII